MTKLTREDIEVLDSALYLVYQALAPAMDAKDKQVAALAQEQVMRVLSTRERLLALPVSDTAEVSTRKIGFMN